jgi:hypothetical protein
VKTAILCPGPSLPELWCDDFFDEYAYVIAVNSAAWHYKTHWLVGADRHIFEPIFKEHKYPKPLRGVVTNSVFGKWAEMHGLEALRPPLQDKEKTPLWCPNATKAANVDVCGYSFPNAIWLAYEFITKPEDLQIFGFDLAQIGTDFAGVRGDHGKNRWATELYWLRDIWKKGIGINGKASEEVRAYLEHTSARNPFAA